MRRGEGTNFSLMALFKKEAPEAIQSNTFLESNGRKIDATQVSQFFDRSVVKIKDNKGKIATRAENGYFYLPGKSGQQAFYLAPGETARVYEKNNARLQVYQETRERGKRGIINETKTQIRNVDNEIINYEGTRAYYADPQYQSKETIKDIEQKLNAELGTNLSGNTPRRISDAFIQAVARYQKSKGLMVDGQAGQRTYGLLKGERTISAQELIRQKDLTASESMNKILSNTQYREYLILNRELSNAIAKDASGPLIESGLIGLFKTNPQLNQLLLSKSPAERARIERELDLLTKSYKIEEPNLIGKFLGARGNGYMKDVLGRKIDVRRQKTALIETLSTAALSLVISGGTSVTVLLGKIKTPFTIQKIPNPGPDMAAYAISGRNSYALESENYKRQEGFDYDIATASLKEQEALVGNTASVELAQLAFDAKTDGKLNWKNPSHREAYLRLQRERMNADPKNGPMFKKFVNMASGFTNFDQFAKSYPVPKNPEVVNGLKTFYEGGRDAYGYQRSYGDVGLLYEMISDKTKYIGTASMVRVEMGQEELITHLNKYVNPRGNKRTLGAKEKPDSFTTPLRDLEPSTVKERFAQDNQLMDAYIRQMRELTGIQVSPSAILSGIEQGQIGTIKDGYNTGLESTKKSLRNRKLWGGPALIVAIQTPNSSNAPGVHMIGIRKECGNYVPVGFVPESYVQEYKDIPIKARMGLYWNVALNNGGGGSEKPGKPDKPDKPDKPEVPGKPTEVIDSTPDGNVTPDTGAPGYDANNVAPHTQTIDNTAIEPGQYTPGVDGVAPASNSGIPINTNPKW